MSDETVKKINRSLEGRRMVLRKVKALKEIVKDINTTGSAYISSINSSTSVPIKRAIIKPICDDLLADVQEQLEQIDKRVDAMAMIISSDGDKQ
jgi:hypothetical protein